MPNNTVRWGLAGTGTIAREFARTLAEVPSAILAAAASRTAESSAKFCSEFGIPQQHLSFQDLAHDPIIDAVNVPPLPDCITSMPGNSWRRANTS
ncbi:Gfo/Idh/MocA family oxidoreductase [Paenarthrobacter sp. NPDC091669]|uniref:Gfo/Idh/MocA family oxidoreductase n=1 Tax=Paenarthrobacter sp. NPDC091669 TaxID=3364384 RepID=UPI0037FA303C